jgi:hypothetical protein
LILAPWLGRDAIDVLWAGTKERGPRLEQRNCAI